LDRVEILRELRLGVFDVLVGVNLLREGLDLPEVSLVAIMDADKEGFLRNQRSLIQTIGRAARNVNGRVLMYADVVTDSMQAAIDETSRRRAVQAAYNEANGITPKGIRKNKDAILQQTKVADAKAAPPGPKFYVEDEAPKVANDPVVAYMDLPQLDKLMAETERRMQAAAQQLEFMLAAQLRDELQELRKLREEKAAAS
jgi:excinuclease ABC subunit B